MPGFPDTARRTGYAAPSLPPVRTAILDLYDSQPNQGMRCLLALADNAPFPLHRDVYDVRAKNEVPSLDHDVYLFSGGPGNPVEPEKKWYGRVLTLIDRLFDYNAKHPGAPKHAFFICHSFQILCRHLGLAEVCLRKSPAFGIFPVHKTRVRAGDPVFGALPEPFYAVDSRDWQVIGPDRPRIKSLGARIVALEKIRPHVAYERAVMAVRFSDAVVGTQFHPEADVAGMSYYFQQPEKKKQIIENHGKAKYDTMLRLLGEDDKIALTHRTILPGFLQHAYETLRANG